MNENKFRKLLESARSETQPSLPGDLESRVLREIRRETAVRESPLADQLNFLFPRVALAAVTIVIACAVFEVVTDGPDLTESVAQISDQWPLVVNDL